MSTIHELDPIDAEAFESDPPVRPGVYLIADLYLSGPSEMTATYVDADGMPWSLSFDPPASLAGEADRTEENLLRPPGRHAPLAAYYPGQWERIALGRVLKKRGIPFIAQNGVWRLSIREGGELRLVGL